MRIIGRRRQDASEQETSTEETGVRPFSDVIASIEASAQDIRSTDLPRWKYRQILRDPSRALAETPDDTSAPADSNVFPIR